MGLFYGNKTASQFQSFLPNVTSDNVALSIQVKPVEPAIEAGARVEQMVNVECVQDFAEAPGLVVQFVYCGVQQKFTLRLPVFLNKFLEPTIMNSESFFSRWKNLSIPGQEEQKIFKARFPMENESIRSKLSGFGMQLLDGIDPNPDNFVCAGIIHTRGVQIGSLLRLEPNRQAQMYRLTIRSSKDGVSKVLVDLLQEHF